MEVCLTPPTHQDHYKDHHVESMELPEKFEVDQVKGFSNYTVPSVVAKLNQLIDYLEEHPRSEEVVSWAYTFLGDTANIRCDEDIKTVMVFRGDKSYQFDIPNDTTEPLQG